MSIRVIWEKAQELKKEYEKFVREELSGIPAELLPFLKRGKIGKFDFENFPKGYGISHSWAGYQGTYVEGTMVVIRDGKLITVPFKNNKIEYSENGTPAGESETRWWEKLRDGDVIIAVHLVETEEDFNGKYEVLRDEVILLERPYIYMDIRPEEATFLKQKFQEWLEKMIKLLPH